MLISRHVWAVLVLAAAAAAAAAEAAPPPPPPPPDLAELAKREARRFPQPVRVGDLVGRDVLKPVEAQTVLGKVAHVVRRPDGGVDIVVLLDGELGLGSRSVAVPVAAVALLGQHVAVKDYTPEQLDALPPYADGSEPEIEPEARISVGLTRPFH